MTRMPRSCFPTDEAYVEYRDCRPTFRDLRAGLALARAHRRDDHTAAAVVSGDALATGRMLPVLKACFESVALTDEQIDRLSDLLDRAAFAEIVGVEFPGAVTPALPDDPSAGDLEPGTGISEGLPDH